MQTELNLTRSYEQTGISIRGIQLRVINSKQNKMLFVYVAYIQMVISLFNIIPAMKQKAEPKIILFGVVVLYQGIGKKTRGFYPKTYDYLKNCKKCSYPCWLEVLRQLTYFKNLF